MKQEEDILVKIWDYIENRCNPQEENAIRKLIESNAAWQEAFTAIAALQNSLQTELEQEHAPVRFTQNVMDIIKTQHIVVAKTYVTPFIIKGIAAFFLFTIGGLLAYFMMEVNLSDVSLSLPTPKIELPSANTSLYLFAGINLVLLMVLIEHLLQRRNTLTP